MKKILLVQGANLNYLGKRQPEIYGYTTTEELNAMLLEDAKLHHTHLDIFYTNLEGEAINRIYQAKEEGFQGLVMNPAGFTYAGYALRDCILGVNLPYVEIHISNIAKRKIHCVLSDISIGLITGFGMHGYLLALAAMRKILDEEQKHETLH
jgi:3-dehydroquinate dehydratase-2